MQNKHNCIEENEEGNKYQISFIFLDSIEFVCTVERDKWGGKSYIFKRDQLFCLDTRNKSNQFSKGNG